MINREMRQATVVTYGGVDEYGQMNTTATASRDTYLTFGLYQHTNSNDVRYQNVTHYGLTKDSEITDNDIIVIDGVEYKVLFVNPFGRMREVFLQG